jgi:hypothetical protein
MFRMSEASLVKSKSALIKASGFERIESPKCGDVRTPTECLEVMAADQWKREYSFTLQPRQLSEFAAMATFTRRRPNRTSPANAVSLAPDDRGTDHFIG